jgi:hypothetical protein
MSKGQGLTGYVRRVGGGSENWLRSKKYTELNLRIIAKGIKHND